MDTKIINGYVLIHMPNHPFNQDGYIPEHRLIVESFIGRYLNEKEVVHHINLDKLNNSINNLMLFKNQKEHASFHIKFNKFGLNHNIRNQIAFRWKEYKSPIKIIKINEELTEELKEFV